MKRKSNGKKLTRTGRIIVAFEKLYRDFTILNHLAKKGQMKFRVAEVPHMQGKKGKL